MPELPEVETVKEILKKQIIGDTITDITINYSKIIKETDPATFRQNLIGQTFRDILRRGKYLVFVLDDYILLSHLRMEGKYFIKSPNDEISKHEHIIFRLGPNKTYVIMTHANLELCTFFTPLLLILSIICYH